MTKSNPLLAPWTGPGGAPDFQAFRNHDFLSAFEFAIAESKLEVAAISANDAEPDFDNTILALERSGETLARVKRLFWMLSSAHSDDTIRSIEADVAARLTAFGSDISHDAALFGRVEAVWKGRSALGPEQARLVEKSYKGFISSGAALQLPDKQRLAAIANRLSALSVRFGQNVLAATNACEIVLAAGQTAGIPSDFLQIAAARASDQGLKDQYAFVLDRGQYEALLTFADDRSVREKAWRAFTARCQGGEHDNLLIIAEIVALRQEQAALLGYANYADLALEDSMAETPAAAEGLMMRVWSPALKQAEREQAALQAVTDQRLEAWDWRYFADRVRRQSFAYDAAGIRSQLSLDKIRSAAFAAAERLYGLSFHERSDISVYHPDVQAWSVNDRDGAPVGLLFTDYLARTQKHGGAWMGSLRVQEKMDADIRPIVYTVANFSGSGGDANVLLSLDEARTLFHEFGHALHALLSDVTYPSLAGTSVARDFVEFPSKLMEHWIAAPDALRSLGVPADLVDAVQRADAFGQGFATVEFLASALIDLKLHQAKTAPTEIAAFETDSLNALGTPAAIGMRHKLAYFTHVFDGGYASCYYSYLWSEVLDADVFEAFDAAGDLFDADLAAKVRREILAPGDSRDPMESFMA
ncbi:MAG: M3 family metallopeptidase, partial [Sphingomicrobium sp.]